MSAARIVVVGSFNADLTAYTERLPRPGETVAGRRFVTGPGGKGSNQAVAAARLGAQVTFVGRIGADVFAPLALDLWRREGIESRFVVQDPEQATGVAPILVDDLRRKGFIHTANFSEEQACAPGFASQLTKVGKRAGPLMAFLAEAVGVRW